MGGIDEAVPEALDGERIDRVVSLLTGMSRSRSAAAVEAGLVRLDDVPVLSRSHRVRVGEELDIPELDTGAAEPPEADESVAFTVVHEDPELLVVDKPAGLVVHPGSGHVDGTLVNGLLARYPEIAGVGTAHRPGIVHRLDRGTSGLLLVARTGRAHDALTRLLASRRVDRHYLTLVHGRVDADEGRIEAPIGRSERDRTRMAVAAGGREARTVYTVEARWGQPALTRLRCRLETGRTHQIRVHLSAIGHPLVGDGLYGPSRDPLGLSRPFLHAAHLGVDHPEGGRLELDSAPPGDLAGLLERLGEPGT